MNDEEIGNELTRLDNESDSIRENTIQLTWWMRGGINYDQAWQLSNKERKMIDKLIKDNTETGKKIGRPIY